MAARILHFGQDSCHRLFVLRSAGYNVGQCGSAVQLRTALLSDEPADAVLMANAPSQISPDAVQITRAHSSASLVLFRDTLEDVREEDFDLIIPPLTPPLQWLNDLATLIERSRALRDQSMQLGEESRILRWESAVVREKARFERARSARMRTPRAEELAGNWGLKDDDSPEDRVPENGDGKTEK